MTSKKESGNTNLNTDNVKQSEETGTVQTEEGKTVDAKSGVAAEGEAESEKAKLLSYAEAEKLVGDLEPGDEGWLPLNEKGEIIGPAKKGTPPKGQLATRVVAPIDDRPHPIQTPSGAHLSHRMNADPERPVYREHAEEGTERPEGD